MTQRSDTRFRPALFSLEGRRLLSHGTFAAISSHPVAAEVGRAGHGTIHALSSQPPVYKVVALTHLNQFQDSVQAIRIGGQYAVSFTLGKGTVHKVNDTFQQTTRAVGGNTWMIVAKSPLTPGATVGQIKVSQVVAWYNNVPAIKGLNYTLPGSMNLALFNKVKLGDLIRWVPSANPNQPSYWKLDANLTETEKLLVSDLGNLPNLRNGNIINIAPSSDQYNCYAYAANLSNPTSIGWVEGNQGAPGDAQKVVPIHSLGDLINFYNQQGWGVVSRGSTPPFMPRSGLVAIYLDNAGNPEHAALVTPNGVYAKMGQLGAFRFDSPNQMAGGMFGNPTLWLARPY